MTPLKNVLIAAPAALGLLIAPAAHAEWRGGHAGWAPHAGWGYHGGYYRGPGLLPPAYVAGALVGLGAAAVTGAIIATQPVYAPPPVYYAPPPVYYAPPAYDPGYTAPVPQ